MASFVIFLLCVTAIAVYGLSLMARASTDYFEDNVTQSSYSLLKKIGEQIDLPQEEVKLFLKVKNPEDLKRESDFYTEIEKDNYVIIYPSLAIIYDANTNRVIKTIILKE